MTTMMHAVTDHTVDFILALLIIVGGVAGAQFGVRFGSKLPVEQLRRFDHHYCDAAYVNTLENAD
jgi:uncharacterized membrane protein YfcA